MNNRSLLAIALSLISLMVLIASCSSMTFGSKCKKAGYTGAEFERCVLRAANGGPIYEENVQYKRNLSY